MLERLGVSTRDQDLKTKNVAAAVSGHSVIVKRVSLPVMTREELDEQIRWEAEQHVPFDMANVELDFHLVVPISSFDPFVLGARVGVLARFNLSQLVALVVDPAFVFGLVGRQSPVCKESVRVLLHGHRYDGSRATRELGLEYTDVGETLDRTLTWFDEEGLAS